MVLQKGRFSLILSNRDVCTRLVEVMVLVLQIYSEFLGWIMVIMSLLYDRSFSECVCGVWWWCLLMSFCNKCGDSPVVFFLCVYVYEGKKIPHHALEEDLKEELDEKCSVRLWKLKMRLLGMLSFAVALMATIECRLEKRGGGPFLNGFCIIQWEFLLFLLLFLLFLRHLLLFPVFVLIFGWQCNPLDADVADMEALPQNDVGVLSQHEVALGINKKCLTYRSRWLQWEFIYLGDHNGLIKLLRVFPTTALSNFNDDDIFAIFWSSIQSLYANK